MKRTLRRDEENRGWPAYLLSGRMRTSTFILLLAFLGTSWLYNTYKPAEVPTEPTNQVVPPGFVPDPEYTWVPRTNVAPVPATTRTTSPTTTTTTTSPATTTEPTETTAPGEPTDTTTPGPAGETTTGSVPTTSTSPTTLPPGATPQTTAENRSGTPAPTVTATTPVPEPGASPTAARGPQ